MKCKQCERLRKRIKDMRDVWVYITCAECGCRFVGWARKVERRERA